jgi:acyl-[acyl-carrier-protein] desaturase
VKHLVRRWDVEHLAGLTAEAAEAQDYLCRLGARYAKLAERSLRRAPKTELRQFSWIFNRAV